LSEPSVEFVWDEYSKKWVLRGDVKKLCKFIDVETQTCRLTGHTCLTPDPEYRNCPVSARPEYEEIKADEEQKQETV